MDPIVMSAGAALISAMATDGWQQAREGLVTLWRRVRPAEADTVDEELATVRTQVLSARDTGDTDLEEALAGDWLLRLQALLREDPSLAGDLRQLLDERPDPAGANTPAHGAPNVFNTHTSGNAMTFNAGRDQHINTPGASARSTP